MDFKDKTVVVTGGSEGVGAATARAFADTGANLMLVARGKRKLERIAVELREKTRVEIYAMDVADDDACSSLFKKAKFEFDRIDVLINNAGYHVRGPAESIDAHELGKMIDVNLKAPIVLSRLVLPYLRESGGGAIINVASLAGRTPVPGAAAYSASKFGLRAFTFALADEIQDRSIKLAVVSPGPIDTGFIMSNIDNVVDLTFSQPMSTPEGVADEILKLCVNSKRERSMPPVSGLLTTLTYLFPPLGKALRPLLSMHGRRVKKKLKADLLNVERSSE
ncbi:MAG: SDR family oxidoreductase [Woeseia sp.]|jgi:short-subunit dehydrogenase|nr:SDR family oxidoreductase [Woeseia sp.]MBT6209941.1 SDR family oxidoreductase [Woeseia sp.]